MISWFIRLINYNPVKSRFKFAIIQSYHGNSQEVQCNWDKGWKQNSFPLIQSSKSLRFWSKLESKSFQTKCLLSFTEYYLRIIIFLDSNQSFLQRSCSSNVWNDLKKAEIVFYYCLFWRILCYNKFDDKFWEQVFTENYSQRLLNCFIKRKTWMHRLWSDSNSLWKGM